MRGRMGVPRYLSSNLTPDVHKITSPIYFENFVMSLNNQSDNKVQISDRGSDAAHEQKALTHTERTKFISSLKLNSELKPIGCNKSNKI